MEKDARIFVAGHRGLVGSALVRALRAQGYENLLLAERRQVDLRDQAAVRALFAVSAPEYVFMAAAKVGGIVANDTYPADFIYDNLMIEANVIHAAAEAAVQKLLFLGSTCVYPKLAPQPLKEEYLLTGPLEPTNEWYAVAKIAGIKLCQAYRKQHGCRFISVMPTNLYGPGDNFEPETSHVVPALLRRFHEAKVHGDPRVVIWGTGTPRREFLFVDDCASACLFLMRHYDEAEPINIGWGKDIAILELAEIMKSITRFHGDIVADPTKPDGTPQKLVDVTKLQRLGWRPRTPLGEGLQRMYDHLCADSPLVPDT